MPFEDPWHTRPTDPPQEEPAEKNRKRRLPAFLADLIELMLEIVGEIIDALT